MGKRIDREGPIHRACLTFLRTQLPGAVIHHSANEFGMKGREIARQIAKNKRNGMLPGFPDILVIHEGLCMGFEVKAEGGQLQDTQREVGKLFEQNGAFWAVVRSVEDVRECLDEWLGTFPCAGDNFTTLGEA